MIISPLLAVVVASTPSSANSEVGRVQAHLRGAEALIESRDASSIPPEVKARRDHLIEVLRAYREAGEFPRNYDFSYMTPYFVDRHGTRCALAELVWASGDRDLVHRIAETANNAYVHDLADDPELSTWLTHHGFTLEEAARIQPAYCSQRADVFCRREPPEGFALARFVEDGAAAEVFDVTGDTGDITIGSRFDVRDGSWNAGTVGYAYMYRGGELTGYAYALDESGIRSPSDPACEGAPRIPTEDIEAVLMSDPSTCLDRITRIDPRFGGRICGFEQNETVCQDDLLPAPFEPWPEDPTTDPSAPSAPDDGPAAAPSPSASRPNEGGCRSPNASTALAPLLLAGALLLLRRVA